MKLGTRYTLRLPPQLLAKLHKLAKRDRRGFADWMRVQLEKIANEKSTNYVVRFYAQ